MRPLSRPTPVLAEVEPLADRIAAGGVLVLSGAGISTESGIPDYRGPTGRARPATPMTYQEFVGSPAARQRYWARSHIGWKAIARAAPNAGHRAVADLEHGGLLAGIITQNVDGLHQAAGARQVIELHGGLDRVICLSCARVTRRVDLDHRLHEANQDVLSGQQASSGIKPDGDVELAEDQIRGFRVLGCSYCDTGILKPDVVFFGENVPAPRVSSCYGLVARARMLLVLGSSLTVASGFRFVRRAATLAVPVAIVNQGQTRGDPLADVRLDAPLGPALSRIVEAAVGRR